MINKNHGIKHNKKHAQVELNETRNIALVRRIIKRKRHGVSTHEENFGYRCDTRPPLRSLTYAILLPDERYIPAL